MHISLFPFVFSFSVEFLLPNGTIHIRASKSQHSWKINSVLPTQCGSALALCCSKVQKLRLSKLLRTVARPNQQKQYFFRRAPATRICASIWWFFTLIMVSSYTANLAAFLTVETLTSPIKSVEDLKECGLPDKECPVKFGAKKDGSTLNFFKESEHPTYRNMYAYMMAHPEELTVDNAQGLEWAQNTNYAFLMESSSIEYIIERHCDGNV